MVGEATTADGSPIHYLDTASAYDLWAEHYDTDGNFLTAVDSAEMSTLLPELLSRVGEAFPRPRKVVDLGCGTGRNTVHLLALPGAEVVALDLSPRMLDVARRRLAAAAATAAAAAGSSATCAVYDMLAPPSPSSPPAAARGAAAVVSTLVAEHVPLPTFLAAAARMLAPGGLLLLTNMHAEMGRATQAGFVDPATGRRVRPTGSHAHSVADVVAEAGRRGFEVASPFRERLLAEGDVVALGPRAAKYVGVRVWYGGILRKRSMS